jgi:hypothetical protein
MVVTSSQDKAMNWATCIALRMAFLAWVFVNPVNIQLAKFD